MSQESTTDPDLLGRWVNRRDEGAFHALVARYAGLVHQAARRVSHDDGIAAEASQLTFVALAAKARGLVSRDSLAGWLHLTAVHHARNLTRKRLRDHAKIERLRHHMNPPSQDPTTTWEELQPHLDASLAALSTKDREALLLRFYRSLTVAEIAGTLGIATAAAQKRLDRAMQRLRRQLSQRGCVPGAALGAALLAGLGADAKAAIPAVSTLAKKAIATTAVGGTSVLTTITMTMTMTKNTAITAAIVLVGAGAIVAIKQNNKETPATPPTTEAPARDRAKAGEGGDAGGSTASSRIRERETRGDADLIARYGESRTSLSDKVTQEVIAMLDEFLEMANTDEVGMAMGGRQALIMGLGDVTESLAMTDEQMDKAVALMGDYRKRELERIKQSVDNLRDNPRTLTSLFLVGDAFARGEIDEAEYQRTREEHAAELKNIVINPLDLMNQRRQPLGDPDFNAAMTAMLDENQAATYQNAVEEYSKREAADSADAVVGAIPAMDLENLDNSVVSARKMTGGLLQMMEGMGGLRDLQQNQPNQEGE